MFTLKYIKLGQHFGRKMLHFTLFFEAQRGAPCRSRAQRVAPARGARGSAAASRGSTPRRRGRELSLRAPKHCYFLRGEDTHPRKEDEEAVTPEDKDFSILLKDAFLRSQNSNTNRGESGC